MLLASQTYLLSLHKSSIMLGFASTSSPHSYSFSDTYWILLLILSIIILALLLFLLTTIKSHKEDRKKIIELEQRLLLSQMNPHFIFNSLTAIQSYIFRNEPYLAGKYLANFSKLVRLILENSRLDLIPISKEIETLKHYLELQSIRFDNRFEHSISVDPDIDTEHHVIPPMLAQPFIENAIEHGIIHLIDKGIINIRFLLSTSAIVLEVEDNGVGIDKSSNVNIKKWKEHESLATRITDERLINFKKTHGKSIKMETIDLTQLNHMVKLGTMIRFTIPILQNN